MEDDGPWDYDHMISIRTLQVGGSSIIPTIVNTSYDSQYGRHGKGGERFYRRKGRVDMEYTIPKLVTQAHSHKQKSAPVTGS